VSRHAQLYSLVAILTTSVIVGTAAASMSSESLNVAINASTVEQEIAAAGTVVPEVLTCQECGHSWDGSNHSFWAGSCSGEKQCYDCERWNSCHSNPQEGYCYMWHYGCDEVATEELAVAITNDDSEAIAELVRRGAVEYNAERGLLQVVCGDRIVFSAPRTTS
jgi:hypothetical protein